MRVCLITEYFYPDNLGGGGPVLSQLIRSLTDQYGDIKVDVITSRNLYRTHVQSLSTTEDWNGINITRITTPKATGLPTPLRMAANLHFSVAALVALFRRRKYDLTIVCTSPPTVAMAAHVYKRHTGTPYLYIIHDLQPDGAVAMKLVNETHPAKRVLQHYQRRWLHGAARVAVLGRCMRDHLVHKYDLAADQIAVIPAGEDPERITPGTKQGSFRQKHGIDGFMVLYSGNFGRFHNFDTILDAAKKLETINESITFVLAGGGPQREHIARRIEREGIKNVKMFEYVPNEEYSAFLSSADVALVTLEPGVEGLCVPSKFYGIMAAGVPTVALVSPRSEIGYVVEESNCGVQVEQGDTDKLVNTLRDLSYDPARREEMGRNARNVLVERYTTSALTSLYYQEIHRALGQERAFGLRAGKGAIVRPASPLLKAEEPTFQSHSLFTGLRQPDGNE